MISRAPQIKDYLETELSTAMPGMRIGRVPDENEIEQIVIGRSKSTREFGGLGRNPVVVDELPLEIILAVEVLYQQRDPEAAEERAWAICDSIETVIRNNIRLGLSNAECRNARISTAVQSTFRTDRRRGVQIALTLQAETRT